jgi:uncharacterized protein YgbK (DUF1537 family)
MPELAIIADDLTGALDAAAPFAMRGISTAVALSAATLPEAVATGARVIGVSTNSREVPADEARARTDDAVAVLPVGTRLFKKVDSRLKGNIAAELDAIPHSRSLVVPAIPAFGRWMRGGKIGGFGVSEPVDVAARLGPHSAKATIPDIELQADIAAALVTVHDLPIGARGLAEAMAAVMAPEARVPDTTLHNARAYVVIGSTDPITTRQLARLRATMPDLTHVAAPNGVGPAILPAASRLTVLQATPGATSIDAKSVAAALAETVGRFAPPAGSLLVLSGGATAQVILERLGVRVLELVGEVLPGLPLAQGGDLTFVTKSGGFGDEDCLLRLLAPYHAHEERIA